jgi:5-methylcytosine-specific restriction endonuclease McrA
VNLSKRSITSKHARAAIFLRAYGRCTYCNVKLDRSFHVDHVIPYKEQAITNPHEMVASCPTCNLKKGAKIL